MGELFYIIGGMVFGALVGCALAEARADGMVAEFGISGSMLGTLVGYFLVWCARAELRIPKDAIPLAEKVFPPQIVGAKCATCGVRLLAIFDGTVCPVCRRIHHTVCQPNLPCSLCHPREEASPSVKERNSS